MQLEGTKQLPRQAPRDLADPVAQPVARAAFLAAVKAYPTRRLVLRWGMMVLQR